ncbi:hypothetical protein B0T16DRAFT_460967 [Cercophora newfieldiana]|uniref:Uncharacterized protein n=1 Tax=Cercophora newfieldiana TaxID=92897 RepID=A0AA39XVE0_9PEZI|nr:hypothetical protein B0T16DRAFT_460967 [Cercophora newfieldiana]
MTLSCRSTNETLHTRGREVLAGFLQGVPTGDLYKPAKSRSEEPAIPAPEIFQHEPPAADKDSTSRIPTISECAIHLELLEAFFVLREKVLRSDDIDKAMGISRNRETKAGYNGDTKTLKDTTFEKRRLEKWPKFVEFAVVRFLGWHAWLAKIPRPKDIASFQYRLPPLDVLMVWHAFLLNPLLFNKHCRKDLIYELPFPWERIHDCINSRDWSFQLPADDTTQEAPLFDVLSKWDTYLPNESCKPPVTAANSNPLLTFSFIPMATSSPANSKSTSSPPSLLLPAFTFTSSPSEDSTSKLPTPVSHHATLFRIITSNTNLSTLATSLRDAVIRQNSFIDKMNSHLWIRSPALQSTLTHAIARYTNFLLLMRRNKGTMLVPTVDIDLVWHTHQCAAWGYVVGVKERVGRFVNHDDDLEKGVLSNGAGDTRKLWRLAFGSEYRKCGCWDCEALLEEVERVLKEGKDENGPDMEAVAKRVDERVRYYRAVEAARRKGRALPVRPKDL